MSENDWTIEDQRHLQVTRGLRLSPAERLQWLEETMEETRRLLGRARRAPAHGQRGDQTLHPPEGP